MCHTGRGGGDGRSHAALLLTLRAALLMALGAIEDALGLPRTLPSRKERRAERAGLPIIDG
jgi:hypothetical protein